MAEDNEHCHEEREFRMLPVDEPFHIERRR